MGTARAVIITGMHRSGTSLVANLLGHAGVRLGEALIEADEGNRYGYFEDVGFNNFHKDLLARFGQSYLVQDVASLGEITPEEEQTARELIKSRNAQGLWGFKDPRTCLFLDFWHDLRPESAYIFVYRHPLEVVLSLLRRGRDFDLDALVDPLAALRSWETHNRLLLDFHLRHPDRSFLGHIAAISADTERFVDLVSKKLALTLRAKGTQTLYHPDALNQMKFSTEVTSILDQIAPAAMQLYRDLNARADLPSPSAKRVIRKSGSRSSTLTQVSELASRDGAHESSHLFALFLASLAPREVLAGKESLDGLRRNRIGTLEAEAVRRERLMAAQTEELTQARDRASDLDRRVAAYEERLTGQTAHAEKLSKLAASQQEQIQAASAQVERLGDVVASQAEQLKGLAAEIAELRRMLADKDLQVQGQTTRNTELERMLATEALHLREKEHQTEKLQRLLASKDEHLKHWNSRAVELERLLASQRTETQTLQKKVDQIEASRVWRLAQKWYAFKFALGFKPRLLSAEAPAGEEVVASWTPEAISSSPSVGENSNGNPKVLFLSHDARPHGAQIVFLHFLRWFRANSQIPFEVLLKEDGLLRPEFEALAPVTVWNGKSPASLEAHLRKANVRLIYSNTITNGRVIDALSGLNCPVICHVHELDYCLNYQTERDNNKHIKRLASHYVAVSRAVQQSLLQNLKIRESQIDVVYEFIPTALGQNGRTRARDRVRNKLNIPPDSLVVGGCGTTDWRKGPDLFIQLARMVRERQAEKPVHFVWVGGQSEGPHFAALWHDVKHMELEEYVHFTGAVRNPLDYFSAFDVFVLTSREDPYPLVNLEVASLGTPIVCFEGSGGSKEFVEDDCGFVVPYLDLETMADRVSELLGGAELRQRLGERAAAKVRERHDVERAAPQLLGIIERFL